MAKPVVDARQVLEDIREGMDDSSLMKKYNLSAKGLADLFRQLSAFGLIRWLNAQDVISDIRKGMSDEELIEKYKLSWIGLERLFAELGRAGVSVSSIKRARAGNKKKISQTEIVHDIHSGMTEAQLMEKYDLSSWGLQKLFSKLLRVGAVTWEALAIVSLNSADSVTLRNMRQCERSYPTVSMVVYEQEKPRIKGRVLDISEKGLGVIGIPSEVGDMKSLTIASEELPVLKPFELQAACRWFKKGDLDITCTAGFAITHIEESDLVQLRDFLDSMATAFPG
jgi:uncharacterized protein (DUF433 family)